MEVYPRGAIAAGGLEHVLRARRRGVDGEEHVLHGRRQPDARRQTRHPHRADSRNTRVVEGAPPRSPTRRRCFCITNFAPRRNRSTRRLPRSKLRSVSGCMSRKARSRRSSARGHPQSPVRDSRHQPQRKTERKENARCRVVVELTFRDCARFVRCQLRREPCAPHGETVDGHWINPAVVLPLELRRAFSRAQRFLQFLRRVIASNRGEQPRRAPLPLRRRRKILGAIQQLDPSVASAFLNARDCSACGRATLARNPPTLSVSRSKSPSRFAEYRAAFVTRECHQTFTESERGIC